MCADVVLIDPRFLPLIAHYTRALGTAKEFPTYLEPRLENIDSRTREELILCPMPFYITIL